MGGKERETGKYTSKMIKYDPADDKWTTLSNLRRPKTFFTINVLDRRIIITGGWYTKHGEMAAFKMYDLQSQILHLIIGNKPK